MWPLRSVLTSTPVQGRTLMTDDARQNKTYGMVTKTCLNLIIKEPELGGDNAPSP